MAFCENCGKCPIFKQLQENVVYFKGISNNVYMSSGLLKLVTVSCKIEICFI